MKASFRVQNVIEKISMLSLVIEDFKKSVCSSVHLSQIVVWHSVTGLYVTLHSSPTRLEGIHHVQIHLIGIRDAPGHRSVRNKEVKLM